jgi:aspartyl aminopeptidase
VRPGGKYFFTRNMSAVCAFAVGKKHVPGSGFVIIGAHTDSPCPRLKPKTKAANETFLQVRVQNYGGGLWYTWFDRDLGVAGRVLVNRRDASGNATPKHELVRVDRPVMRISSLAIHLDRSLNDGFKVNFQSHMAPIIADEVQRALGGGGGDDDDSNDDAKDAQSEKRRKTTKQDDSKHCPVLLELFAEQLRCDPADILDFECQLCDAQPSAIGGARNEYVFSGRLDNLQSCHASLCALIRASSDASLEDEHLTRMMVHYDHEEVGSDSAQGAGSSMTEDALRRITRALAGAERAGDADDLDARARRASFVVSADMAHAVHPNYSDKHEPGHRPRFGAGVVIKHNANQRYATDAITGWLFREIGERYANVPVQEFVVRSDLGCGSTIGPTLSTNTGIRTVDVGAPQLSMHSVREMCSAKDVKHAVDHYAAVYEKFGQLDATLVVDGRIGNLCRECA